MTPESFFFIIIHGHMCEDRSGLDPVINYQADWLRVFIWRRAEPEKEPSGFPQWQIKTVQHLIFWLLVVNTSLVINPYFHDF